MAETKPAEASNGTKPSGVKALLKGLTFHTNKAIEEKDEHGQVVMVHGRPKVRYIPVERDLTEDDVLKYYVSDGAHVIVTKDGKKYRIKQ